MRLVALVAREPDDVADSWFDVFVEMCRLIGQGVLAGLEAILGRSVALDPLTAFYVVVAIVVISELLFVVRMGGGGSRRGED